MKTGVLDLEAPVHDDVEPGVVGQLSGDQVGQAELGPKCLCPAPNGVTGEGLRSSLRRNTSTMSGGTGRSARLG
jgi:hypothetical protein